MCGYLTLRVWQAAQRLIPNSSLHFMLFKENWKHHEQKLNTNNIWKTKKFRRKPLDIETELELSSHRRRGYTRKLNTRTGQTHRNGLFSRLMSVPAHVKSVFNSLLFQRVVFQSVLHPTHTHLSPALASDDTKVTELCLGNCQRVSRKRRKSWLGRASWRNARQRQNWVGLL